MPNAAILLADGFETTEALTTVDILRRAGIKTRLVSCMGTTHVITAQQIRITSDVTVDGLDTASVDCFIIPGGTPGVKRLSSNGRVVSLLRSALDAPHVLVAAICAGPMVLAEHGLLKGRHVTAFPSCHDAFDAECLIDAPLVIDGDLITARSMSCTLPFALAIVERLAGSDASRKVLSGIGELPEPSEVFPS